MRISTRLAIAAAIPAVMALAMAVGLLVSFESVSELQAQQAIAAHLSADLNEMNDLARSYVTYHQERIVDQFMSEHAEALSHADEVKPMDAEQAELWSGAQRDIVLMKSLFLALVRNEAAAGPDSEDPLFTEAEERLAAQLFIRSRDANAAASRWSTRLSEQIVQTQQRIYLINLGFIMVVGVVLTVGLLGLHRSIRLSLKELKAGTERVGGGDLDYRISPVQTDELGDLGRSFDQMTGHLQALTVSRDELEREVEERKRAQDAAAQAASASATLAEISLRLAQSPLLDESLPEALDLSLGPLGAVGMVLSVRKDDGWLTRVAVGLPGEESGHFVLDSSAPARGRAEQTRAPHLVSDAQRDSRVDGEVAKASGYRSYVAYPLILHDEVVASLLAYFPQRRDALTASQTDFLDRLAYILSLSLENERLFQSEQRRRRRVEALHQVTEVAVSSLDPRDVGQGVVDYLTVNGFDYVSVWMARGEQLECLASGNYPAQFAERLSPMHIIGEHQIAKVYRSDTPMVVADATRGDAEILGIHISLGLKFGSYSIVPVRSRGRTIGVLQFGWREPREMLDEDLRFYSSLGNELGVVLENARLYETEHDISERLQSALLSLPARLDGVDFAHAYHSASESARVGGDFYDLFEIDDARVGVTIGDVAGKGLNAAVLTSLVKNTVRAHAVEKAGNPGKILELANDVVYRATAPESFVTVFFGVLDRVDGSFRYANGGHTTAMVANAQGGAQRLESTGPMLGAFEGLQFGQAEVASLGEEHVVFLYTDGLVEARRGDEQYGEARLVGLLEAMTQPSPLELVEQVIADVLDFTSMELRDDLAMLAVRRTAFAGRLPHQERLEL